MWLVSNLVAALVLGAVLAAITGAAWFLLPAGIFIGLAFLGGGWVGIQLKLYQTWNRLADFVRRAGFRSILYLSHGILLRAIGPEGSKFDAEISQPVPTSWASYQARFDSGTPTGHPRPIDEALSKGWTRDYVEWARSGANRWALLLLPFLLMLSLFSQNEEEATAPSNIYTLF